MRFIGAERAMLRSSASIHGLGSFSWGFRLSHRTNRIKRKVQLEHVDARFSQQPNCLPLAMLAH